MMEHDSRYRIKELIDSHPIWSTSYYEIYNSVVFEIMVQLIKISIFFIPTLDDNGREVC